MSAASQGSIWTAGVDVLKSIVDEKTKTILVQIGNVIAETVDSDNAEWWQHVGFLSRPSKPDAKRSAAQTVILRGGDRDVAFASRDRRGQELAGNLKDGETVIYAPGDDGNGQARTLYKADGSITHFTRMANAPGGVGIINRIGADGSFSFVSPLGALTLDATGWTITAGGKSVLVLGSSGSVKLQGNGLCEVAGKITCVGTNCLPAPTNTALKGITGVAGTPSTNVYIGT